MQTHNKKESSDSENRRLKLLIGIGLPQEDIDILEEIKYGRANTRTSKY